MVSAPHTLRCRAQTPSQSPLSTLVRGTPHTGFLDGQMVVDGKVFNSIAVLPPKQAVFGRSDALDQLFQLPAVQLTYAQWSATSTRRRKPPSPSYYRLASIRVLLLPKLASVSGKPGDTSVTLTLLGTPFRRIGRRKTPLFLSRGPLRLARCLLL